MAERIRKTARYNGKKYEATGKTELEAIKKLAAMLAAAEQGEISSNSTVDAWFNEWMALYKEKKDMTPKSRGMYYEKYNKYIKPAIGHMKLKNVRDVHLQKILNAQAGMSKSHVQKVRMVLQAMFKRARISRLIVYDPAEALEMPEATEGKHRSITEEERAAILAVAEYHRSSLWILTLLYTGMRPGETASLKWADVDFERNEIHVHTARESGHRNIIKEPKTDAGSRDIPIHAALLPRLRAARKGPFEYVFPTGAGNPQNENSLRRLWTSFRRELDIYMGAETYRSKIIKSVVAEDLVPYCLRHTYCTDLERAGVPINVAKELMGHADIQTTANIYTHKDNDVLHQNVALLDGTGGNCGGK